MSAASEHRPGGARRRPVEVEPAGAREMPNAKEFSGLRGLFGVIAVGAALALALPLTVPSRVAAEDTPAALAKYAGNYKYAGTREQGVAIVEKATEEALA